MQDSDDPGSVSSPPPEYSATRSLKSAPNTGEPVPPRPQGPERVGRFLLLRVLGEGGMGVVYAAYDPELDRKVALKLLRVKETGTDEVGRTRLVREAQAMARISHPNVIPVFEAGPWDGEVYVAMELVDGGTLNHWVQEQPRGWREVLEKFLAAGRGLAAAHAAGLVHRDFKLANVLVGRDGRVFVTDFGLARGIGEAARPHSGGPEPVLPVGSSLPLNETLTRAGSVVGTPSYMSPEQFRGEEVDARSDQFSFCAALYRALYGQRPFDPEQLSKLAEARRPRSPPTPGVTLSLSLEQPPEAPPAAFIQEPPKEARVPTWVRRIVMRGLSLEPGERFPSMEALLEALSQDQRLSQRRRQWGLGAALTGLLAAVGTGTWWSAQVCQGADELLTDTWSRSARQRVTAAFETTGSSVAGELAQRVGDALDTYAGAWARQHTEACEDTRVRQVQTEALLSQRVVCLERRRKDMRALVEVLAAADNKGVEKALDAVYALPSPEDCADVDALSNQQTRPADPEQRAALEQLEGQLSEVKAQVDMSRLPTALEKARALEPKVLATGYLPLMAELRFHLGWIQAQRGEKEQGAGLLEQAVYDAEAGRADRLRVSVLNKLLYVEAERQRFDHALRWARLGEATLHRLGGDAVLESDLLVNQANMAIMQEQPQRAPELLRKASERLERVLPREHPKRARVAFTLGRTLLELGNAAQARPVLEEALSQTEAAVGPLHLDMARRHIALAMALRELKELPRALEQVQAAVRIRRSLQGPTHLAVAEALEEEGMALLALGRYEEALKVYEEALAVKRQHLEEGHEDLQYSYDGIGQALLGLGRTREALEPLRRAVSFADAQQDSLGEAGFALANALWKEGQSQEARTEAARAQEHFTASGRAERAQKVRAWLDSLPPDARGR